MFGDFYHNHRLIPSSQISTIKDGTPLVRMSNIFPYYQFGIYYKGRVIQQRFDSRDELTFYEELPMNQFLIGRDLKLFEYTPVKYEYSKLESLELAKSCLNDNPQVGAFSVFGDDFVFYCLVGDRMESFFNGSKMGRHFKHKYKEGF